MSTVSKWGSGPVSSLFDVFLLVFFNDYFLRFFSSLCVWYCGMKTTGEHAICCHVKACFYYCYLYIFCACVCVRNENFDSCGIKVTCSLQYKTNRCTTDIVCVCFTRKFVFNVECQGFLAIQSLIRCRVSVLLRQMSKECDIAFIFPVM